MPETAALVVLPARVAFDNASQVLEDLARELSARPDPVILLDPCKDFDSSLIAVLLELIRRGQAVGRRPQLQAPTPNLLKLAALYGVQGLLFDECH